MHDAVAKFLNDHPETAFLPEEIGEELNLSWGRVRASLDLLFSEGVVDHRQTPDGFREWFWVS